MSGIARLVTTAILVLVPSLVQAGGGLPGEGDVVPVVGFSGGVNPLARGALYNTPPAVSFAEAYAERRMYRSRRAVLRVRY